MIVGMFVPQLLSATKAAGLLWAAHCCCAGPAHARFGALAVSEVQLQIQCRGHARRARLRQEAGGGSDIQLKRLPPGCLQMSGPGEHRVSADADYSQRASQMGSTHVVAERAAPLLAIHCWNSACNMCFSRFCWSSEWHVCCMSVCCSTCFHNY